VLDRCRIRWGQATEVDEARVHVSSRPLAYDGHHLTLGAPVTEVAFRHPDGVGPHVEAGDWLSLHWDWVCDRLDAQGLATLQHYTDRTLRVANAPAHPAPAALLG
jgi:hypothetical protein